MATGSTDQSPVTGNTLLAEARRLDPGICDRLQALGLSEPILVGVYSDRTISGFARAIGISLPRLLELLNWDAPS